MPTYDVETLKAQFKANLEAARREEEDNTDRYAQAMADAVKQFVKTAIDSARVSFQPNEITGICGSPGSPLTSGAGTNGRIT